jgi:hypothetical protein
MPAGQGEEAERFAAAVELGRSPRSWGDEELARDLEIVAMLRSRSGAYDPSPTAKAQAKQKLMALLADPAGAERPGAGRLLAPAFPAPNNAPDNDPATELLTQVPGPVAAAESVPPSGDGPHAGPSSTAPQSAKSEDTRHDLDDELDDQLDDDQLDDDQLYDEAGRPTAHGTPTRPSRLGRSRRSGAGRHSLPSRPAGRAADQRPGGASLRRFTLVGSAAMVLALALAGAGILASRDALPGDGLYTVKRVSESAGLALTFDEMSRAQRHLDLASTRLGEVEQLVATDPKVTTEDPELVTSAIQEFDDSTGEGARILLTDEDAGNAKARDDLRSWAAEQSARLTQLQPALPAGAQTEDALALLSRVAGRTAALQGQAACSTPPDGVDDLGPVPSCEPAGTTRSQDASGATTAGATNDPTNPDPTSGSGARTGSNRAPGTGSDPGSSTSRQAPADSDQPDLLDPVEDTLNGVLGGSSDDSPSSTSKAPKKSDDDGGSSDQGGDDGGNQPLIEVQVPGLPKLGL